MQNYYNFNLCCGYGQRYTAVFDQYPTVSWSEIAGKVTNPDCSPKGKAHWIIPSTYHEADARKFAVQRAKGAFPLLTVDIDCGNVELQELSAILRKNAPCHTIVIYSSSNATADDKKWRGLVKLDQPIAGNEFKDMQLSFYELLAADGLSCDPALAREGQLVFLPNVPPERRDADNVPFFYQWRILMGVNDVAL